MKNRCNKLVMIISMTSLMAFTSPNFAETEDTASTSFADQIHLTRSTDPVDGGWLPDLTGLPDKNLILILTKNIVDVMQGETDSRCNSIDVHLRLLVFQHFVINQFMANAQDIYFDEKTARKWAHILAMILEESSGDSTNITAMSGHSISTFTAHTNLKNWKNIFNLAMQSQIPLNYQTNFGLTQTSADRLFLAFSLAKNQNINTDFLEGKEGASSPKKIPLNTAIAIRRLIWFYQDFAQGRISQSDSRIYQQDIDQPKYLSRYQEGLKMALLYCGTRFIFQPPIKNETSEFEKSPDLFLPQLQNGTNESLRLEKLENAMASIAYCKLGNAQAGYGKNELDEKCFAQWVTLCPALNIDIAMLTPLSYFQSRNAKPVCEDTFKRLLNVKPSENPGS